MDFLVILQRPRRLEVPPADVTQVRPGDVITFLRHDQTTVLAAKHLDRLDVAFVKFLAGHFVRNGAVHPQFVLRSERQLAEWTEVDEFCVVMRSHVLFHRPSLQKRFTTDFAEKRFAAVVQVGVLCQAVYRGKLS